jgi:sugar O-acyltransferase (sialic acid O-acetyltransferase NeuD family)
MTAQERLIVVGAGGFGREIICWVEDCAAAGRLPKLGGYIDDEVGALPGYDVERVGTIQDYQPQAGDQFVVALGEPAKKRKLVELLQGRGARFATLVHPTCTVVRTATIGEGVILCPYAMMMPDSRAERFVTILNYSGLGHDAVAGEFTTLSSVVDVTGRCVIGKDVSIGSGARLLPGVKVGDGATIGAGSIVVRSVKPATTVFAAPAKTLNMNKGA